MNNNVNVYLKMIKNGNTVPKISQFRYTSLLITNWVDYLI